MSNLTNYQKALILEALRNQDCLLSHKEDLSLREVPERKEIRELINLIQKDLS
jgi:Tfp pilus assembly protein PilO